MRTVGIGIDLGSSSFRIGVFDSETDELIEQESHKVGYLYYKDNIFTQSTHDIIKAIDVTFARLKLSNFNVRSIGVAATCSMVVGKQDGNNLIPTHIYEDFKTDNCQDVLFWMHSAARKETMYLNKTVDNRVLSFFGGKFFPEMAIPKLLMLSKIKLRNELTVIDLHRWLLWIVCLKLDYDVNLPVNVVNSNGIGHDGELFGWKSDFYDKLNLDGIFIGNNNAIDSKISIGDSCIDCYSSWFPTIKKETLNNALFAIAGTSTCFLYATDKTERFFNGIWGPFKDILFNRDHHQSIDPFSVYESGISKTGLLLEQLLLEHPVSKSTEGDILGLIEKEIQLIEKKENTSIHTLVNELYYEEDAACNESPFIKQNKNGISRQPYNDDFRDITLKYIVIVETLAFQIADVIQVFRDNNLHINTFVIVGSQAKNKRMLSVLKSLCKNLELWSTQGNEDKIGVKGAYLLGKSRSNNESLIHSLASSSEKLTRIDASLKISAKTTSLLEQKYLIYKSLVNTKMR